MRLLDEDFNITDIMLACYVPAGTGEPVHKNRPSHGLAFNMGGKKTYMFENGTKLTVGENDIIFLPKHSNYVVRDDVCGACRAINFNISENAELEPFVMHVKNKSEVSDIFIAAEKAFKTKKQGYVQKCKAELYSLIYILICEYNAKYVPSSSARKILPALEYIHNYYADECLEIDFLAELCGIKEAYFRRLFTASYGMSPIRYINNLKLLRAKELLSQNEYSAKAVAEMSGFNDYSYFCRYFKKNVGISPGEYKNNVPKGM